MTVGKLLIGLLIPILVASTYVENIAANLHNKRQEKFVPLVAFSCGYRNQFMSDDGTWKSDDERYATCFSGKLDILKYCRKVYPNLNITNIVEYSHEVSIGKWCREEGSPCKWTHNVRPYHCIDGEFHSEALQVPHDCQFSHVNSREECNDYQSWKVEAEKQCSAKRSKLNKPMTVRSFAVLEPCALDMFTGVEFVCCPNEQAPKDETKKIEEDEEDDDDDTYEDDYSEESDEEEDKEDNTQDPYFKAANWTHEHDDFRSAEIRMDAKHKKKVDKVMKEWAQLEARYAQIKKKDPKGAEKLQTSMKARFQKTVASLEEEHKRMKKEIEAVHEERVQAMLNEKKRDATHNYRQSLSTHVNKPNKHNVLQTLKAYIRAEEKDRLHTLNRYRHLLRTDQEEASTFKPTVLHRLRYINLRINGTLAMLRDFPDLEKYVKPIAVAFWKDIRLDNTPELKDDEIGALSNLDEDTRNKKLVDMYNESLKKVHPSAKLDVRAPSTTSTTENPKDEEKIKILPTESSDSEEDDDEYYEDEQDEEIKKTDAQKKAKIIEIKPQEEVKNVDKFKAPKLVETSVQTDDSNDGSDDTISSSSSSESDSDEDDEEDKNIKELRVDIEPIIDEPPSFYRHEKLTQSGMARPESILGSINFFYCVLIAGFLCAGMFMIATAKRRRAMRGFIEVDVYTPEERHVAGMQVNGYENPTYSFFDSKA